MTSGHASPLSREQFGQMMCSAVRYAIGRRTYVVADTAQIVKLAWPNLTERWQELIARDVSEALDHDAKPGGPSIGDRCDRDTWTGLIDWIREQR